MTTGLWVAISAVVVALAFGGYRAYADGRFRPRRPAPPVVEQQGAPATSGSEPPQPASDLWSSVLAAVPDAARGERATLLQFSSAFCAPCRATRRTLADIADVVPGVAHVEVDAEQHLALVRTLNILRTPTTLVLDASGHEIARAAGAPRKEQVLSALP